MAHIDLNSDLGEGFGPWRMGKDAAMLDIVTSANIACGFHAGDPAGIFAVLKAAAARGTAVGAHIGYRDLVGFGRRDIDIAPAELTAEAIYQIGALQALATAAGTRVAYVKPHGALYNRMAHDLVHADAVIAAIKAVDPALPLMALAHAPVVSHAHEKGVTVISEIFADRGYRRDGSLVPRREAGAVLHDAAAIAARLIGFLRCGLMPTVEGEAIPLTGQSICLHGDTPAAVAIARELRAALLAEGITLRPAVPR